jgi:hypothetical protein
MDPERTPTDQAPVVTVVTSATVPSALRQGPTEHLRKLVENSVPTDKLQQSFGTFLRTLQHIVAAGQQYAGDFTLEEVAFRAEIGADGEFKLLGTGVQVSAGSAVTFTLRRQPQVDSP